MNFAFHEAGAAYCDGSLAKRCDLKRQADRFGERVQVMGWGADAFANVCDYRKRDAD